MSRSEDGIFSSIPPAVAPAPSASASYGQPGWAIPYGQEFWRFSPAPTLAKTGLESPIGSLGLKSINTAEIIERVSHAFQAVPGSFGQRASSPFFQTTLDNSGLRFKPASPLPFSQPAPQAVRSSAPPEAVLRTLKISRDEALLYAAEKELAEPSILGNTAQRLLSAENDLVEHYEVRQAGVAVTWVLAKPAKGSGPLTVETELAGLEYAGQTENGLHFADDNGQPRVRLGNVTVVDSLDNRWNAAWQVEDRNLRIEVASSILEQAAYPLAIDPIISAEFGLDQPILTPPSFSETAPAVGVNANIALVVWTRGKGEASDPAIRGVRISNSGQILDPFGFEISSLAAEQSVTAVAACGDEFLVTWSAPHGTSVSDWDIYGARLNPDGTLLDAAPLTICGLSSSVQTSPAVAANGNRYLVVWRDSRSTGIYGTLVGRDGSIQASNGLPICTAVNDQYHPAVAALGDSFLVVWQDFRKSTSSQYSGDIYGARISGEGRLLDTNGIAIGIKTNTQWQPSVAALGTSYLVVWEEYHQQGNDIYGARVSSTGEVLDTSGIAISTAWNLQGSPRVTARGQECLVVWQDYRNCASNDLSSDIYGARLNAEGVVLDPGGIPLARAANSQCRPAVASGPPGYMAVWQDYQDSLTTIRASSRGGWIHESNSQASLVESVLSQSPNAEIAPAIAPLGSNYFVVWADNRNISSSGWDIYGARVAGDGHIQDVTGIPISTADKNQLAPALAANSNSLLVVWTDYRNSPAFTNLGDIFGTQIGLDGSVASPGGLALCTASQDQSSPAVASDGSRFMVVWQDARNSVSNALRWDIYGALFDPNLRCADQRCLPQETPLCIASGNQQQPALAFNGDQYLAVWTDYRNGATADIYGTRLDSLGTVLETNGLAICTAKGNQAAPAVAANQGDYLAVWTDFRNGTASDIYGAHVNRDGVLLDPDGIAIQTTAKYQSNPQVLANGRDYLVAWQEAHSGASNNFDLFAAALGENGQLLNEAVLEINTNASHQAYPVLAGNAAGRLLVIGQGSQLGMPRFTGNAVYIAPTNAKPARIYAPRRLPDGRFEFYIAGETGSRYAIEASDLRSSWTSLGVLTCSNGVLHCIDPDAPQMKACFYRIITLP